MGEHGDLSQPGNEIGEKPEQKVKTVPVPRIDRRYIDRADPGMLDIMLEKPIGQKRLELGGEQTFPMLADFSFSPSSKKKNAQETPSVGFCIVEEPPLPRAPDKRQISLITYRREKDGTDTLLDKSILYEGHHVRSEGKILEVVRNGSRFSVRQLTNDGEVQAIIPEQPPPAEDAEDIERKARISRFPDDIPIDMNFHKGSYDVADSEAFDKKLKDDVKDAWVKLAEELGLELRSFPRTEINFWAPTRTTSSHEVLHKDQIRAVKKDISTWRRIKDVVQGHRSFNPNKIGAAGMARMARRRTDIVIREDGRNTGSTAHELLHQVASDAGFYVQSETYVHYGRDTNEGFASIGNLLFNEGSSSEAEFDQLATGTNIKRYGGANAILHWYLWKEKDGQEKAKELAARMNKGEKFLETYEAVYEEPFPDLVRKAQFWHQAQAEGSVKSASSTL